MAQPHPPRCPICRKIRAAHKAGTTGRNQIAKTLGISAASVTSHAKHAGITFDRTMTKVAVEARAVDLRARRQAIVQRLYARAEKNLERLESPDGYSYRVILSGGAEMGATAELVTDDDPPSADERNHSSAISTYLASAVKLEQIDGSATVSKTESIITRLADAFGVNDG